MNKKAAVILGLNVALMVLCAAEGFFLGRVYELKQEIKRLDELKKEVGNMCRECGIKK